MPEPDRPVMTISAVARQVEIDILQIVFARAANGNVFVVGHDHPYCFAIREQGRSRGACMASAVAQM